MRAAPAVSAQRSRQDQDLADQAAGEPIDEHRADHVRRTGLGEAGDAFLIDDIGADSDPIRDVLLHARILGHALGVPSADSLSAFHQDLAIGALHDDIRRVKAQAAIQVVIVVGVDRGLDDISWLQVILPIS